MFEDLDIFLDNLSFGIAKCDKAGRSEERRVGQEC